MRSFPYFLSLTLLGLACGPDTNNTAGSSGDTGTTTAPTTGDTPTTGTTTGTTGDDTTGTATTAMTATSVAETSDATTDPTTTTTDPTTTDATTGEPACPQPLPEDGTPCDVEGQTCGGPCEDQCSFCNLSGCQNGSWQQLEVFPADCLDCDTVCGFIVPAGCDAGPPTQADCVAGCQALEAGECVIPFHALLACIGSMPTFTCDDAGRPVVARCLQDHDDLALCTGR